MHDGGLRAQPWRWDLRVEQLEGAQRVRLAQLALSEITGEFTPDDVLDVVFPVLSVRLGLEINEANRVIQEVLDAVPVPDYSEETK